MAGLSSLEAKPIQGKNNDAGLDHLTNLPRLKYLILDGTSTTKEGRDKIRKALPNCTVSPRD